MAIITVEYQITNNVH